MTKQNATETRNKERKDKIIRNKQKKDKATAAATTERKVKTTGVIASSALRKFIANRVDFLKLLAIKSEENEPTPDILYGLQEIIVNAVFTNPQPQDVSPFVECITGSKWLLEKIGKMPKLIGKLKKYLLKQPIPWFSETKLDPIVSCRKDFAEQEHKKKEKREKKRSEVTQVFARQLQDVPNIVTIEVPVVDKSTLEEDHVKTMEKTDMLTLPWRDERCSIQRLTGKVSQVGANTVKIMFKESIEPRKLQIDANKYKHRKANVFVITKEGRASSCTFKLSADAKRLNIKGFNVPFSAYHTEEELKFISLLCEQLLDACTTIVMEYFNTTLLHEKCVYTWISANRRNGSNLLYHDDDRLYEW